VKMEHLAAAQILGRLLSFSLMKEIKPINRVLLMSLTVKDFSWNSNKAISIEETGCSRTFKKLLWEHQKSNYSANQEMVHLTAAIQLSSRVMTLMFTDSKYMAARNRLTLSSKVHLRKN